MRVLSSAISKIKILLLFKLARIKFHEQKFQKVSRNEETNAVRRCAYQGVKNVCLIRKIWHALFSWNTRFEIHPFALLPTKWSQSLPVQVIIFQKKVTRDCLFTKKKYCALCNYSRRNNCGVTVESFFGGVKI